MTEANITTTADSKQNNNFLLRRMATTNPDTMKVLRQNFQFARINYREKYVNTMLILLRRAESEGKRLVEREGVKDGKLGNTKTNGS